MRNLMRIKANAHSLVNYAFYGLIFVSGFILGKLGSIFNIKDIIGQYLESRF